jgi:micrococcal nuclease
MGANCIPNDNRQYARVTRIIDGDTIEVDIGGQTYRVRYIGMDTPENTSQIDYFGPEATYKNRLLVEGKTVLLFRDVSETDRYNRLLRYVVADNIFVNYELVRAGYASVATYPPDVACKDNFLAAQSFARQSLLGFWAPTPIPAVPGGGTNCNPSYPDVCLKDGIGDWDCAGGSGNGPNYISGPIRVLPPDPFDLDRDGDGWGCE